MNGGESNSLRCKPSSELVSENFSRIRSPFRKLFNLSIVADVTSTVFFNFNNDEIFTFTECPHGMIRNIALDVRFDCFESE